MESKYAIRLYQLLQRWAFVGKKRLSVEDLRLRLGARELDKNGEIIKDNLPAYRSLKQKALRPAVDEINEKSDLSVSFTEEKQKGSKAIAALNFRIRKNLETVEKFDEIKLPKKNQMELPFEQVSLSMQEQSEIDRISSEFALNAKQAAALADYVARDGITYLLEKAEIVRAEPRQNAARAFIAALRDDWKKPLAIQDRHKAEKAKERQEAAQRRKAEEEAQRERENADWENDKSRIREYLDSLNQQKRNELELAALTASPFGQRQISRDFRQSIIDSYVLAILKGRGADH
jgi:plasmid replication initiation protein